MSESADQVDPPIVRSAKMTPDVSASNNEYVTTGWPLVCDLATIVLWITVTDWLLYHAGTFFCWAIFLCSSLIFLPIAKRTFGHKTGSLTVMLLIAALVLKLSWCGSYLQIACGVGLVVSFGMALSGLPPVLPEILAFTYSIVVGAALRMSSFRLRHRGSHASRSVRLSAIQVYLPACMVIAFSSLFVLANPDVAKRVSLQLRHFSQSLQEFLSGFEAFEVVFWIGSGWFILGLLYPVRCWMLRHRLAKAESAGADSNALYAAYRNSLICVIILFAGYLVFEFATLWFRTFPENFYYAGYAHQGALWLTIALALATMVLSIIFRQSHLVVRRASQLRVLAWVWSAENLLLSAAVYNRLIIYIDFNGMTRMRIVGLLGITAVVAGFLVVVVKIAHNRGFIWLVHRQLWILTGAVLAFAILPVDWIVSSYNVQRVLRGELSPSVQMISHRTSAAGVLPIARLVDVDDDRIREGARALLALWSAELDGLSAVESAHRVPGESQMRIMRGEPWRSELGHDCPWSKLDRGFAATGRRSPTMWQNLQLSEVLLRQRLKQIAPKISPYNAAPLERERAIEAFFQYAYTHWY